MKRSGGKAVLGIMILAIVIFVGVTSANAKNLSNKEASDIIQGHIAEVYTILPIEFEASPFADFEKIEKAEEYGIIRTVLKSGLSLGDKNRSLSNALIGDVFKIEITSKGQGIQHFTTPDNQIAFQVMSKKVDEIVQIQTDDKENYAVYFSYTGVPNELGKVIQFEKDSYRWKGKAIIKYDVFTKRYLLDNLWWSPWDRLEWGKTQWITIEDGEKTIRSTK